MKIDETGIKNKSLTKQPSSNVFFLRLEFINSLLDEKTKEKTDDEIKFLNLIGKDTISEMKNKFNSTDLNETKYFEELKKYDENLLQINNVCPQCKTKHFEFNKNNTTAYEDIIKNNNPKENHYIIQVAGCYELTMGGAQDGATREHIQTNITYPTGINKELYKLSEINYKDKINESLIMVHLDAKNKKDQELGLSYIVNIALDSNKNKEMEKYMLEKQYKSFFILSAIIQKLDINKEKNINIIPTSLGAGGFNNDHKTIESVFNNNKNQFSSLFKDTKIPTLTFYFFDNNSVINSQKTL